MKWDSELVDLTTSYHDVIFHSWYEMRPELVDLTSHRVFFVSPFFSFSLTLNGVLLQYIGLQYITLDAWLYGYYIGLWIDLGLCNNIGIGAALGIVAVAGRSSSSRCTLEHFFVSLPSLFRLLAILPRLNLWVIHHLCLRKRLFESSFFWRWVTRRWVGVNGLKRFERLDLTQRERDEK